MNYSFFCCISWFEMNGPSVKHILSESVLCDYVSFNRLFSCPAGADRRGEAADPALLRVSELLWLQHPGDGESSGWRRRDLLWLQRPRPWRQRRVSSFVLKCRWGQPHVMFCCCAGFQKSIWRQSACDELMNAGSLNKAIVWMWEHMWASIDASPTHECA